MLQQAVLSMNDNRLLSSAHDCSDGGIACTLAECALGEGEAPLGLAAELDEDLRPVVSLFGESHGRIVVSCAPDSTEEVLRIAGLHDVPAVKIGSVLDGSEGFSLKVRGASISTSTDEIGAAYFGAIPSIMNAAPASGA